MAFKPGEIICLMVDQPTSLTLVKKQNNRYVSLDYSNNDVVAFCRLPLKQMIMGYVCACYQEHWIAAGNDFDECHIDIVILVVFINNEPNMVKLRYDSGILYHVIDADLGLVEDYKGQRATIITQDDKSKIIPY
jgi:hypothetical protein